MSEQTTYDRWLFGIGGGAAIVGALLGLVGNLVAPGTPTGDPEGTARVIADSQIWASAHLAILVGLILMLGGLVAIYHSIRVYAGAAGALVRFGFVAAISGVTAGLVLMALEGFASKQLADLWASGPPEQKATALQLVQAGQTMRFALIALFNILFAGFTFILYGLAVAFSHVYPRWLGWVVFLAGVGGVGTGIIQVYVGESSSVSSIMGIVTPTIITLWLVVMGILLVRKAYRPAPLAQDVQKLGLRSI